MASETLKRVLAKVKRYKADNPDQFKKVVKKEKKVATSKKPQVKNAVVVGGEKKDGKLKSVIIASGSGESRGKARIPADMEEVLRGKFNMRLKEPVPVRKFTVQVEFDNISTKGTFTGARIVTAKKVALSDCK